MGKKAFQSNETKAQRARVSKSKKAVYINLNVCENAPCVRLIDIMAPSMRTYLHEMCSICGNIIFVCVRCKARVQKNKPIYCSKDCVEIDETAPIKLHETKMQKCGLHGKFTGSSPWCAECFFRLEDNIHAVQLDFQHAMEELESELYDAKIIIDGLEQDNAEANEDKHEIADEAQFTKDQLAQTEEDLNEANDRVSELEDQLQNFRDQLDRIE